MPSLSIWNHWKNNLFFMIWVIFWNISGIDLFSFLAFKILRAIVTLFLQIFSNQLFLVKNLFLPSYSYLWKFYFLLFFVDLFGFFKICRNCYRIMKAFVIFFIDGIYCCFFYPVGRIYMRYATILTFEVLWHL